MNANLNELIDLEYSNNYATEQEAIDAIEKELSEYEGEFRFLITYKNARFVPVIMWRKDFDYKIMDSVHKNFFTTNA